MRQDMYPVGMSGSRGRVPAELKRAVLMEAGHRCAIPTCRHTTIEIAHIVPWNERRDHEFSNLVALCPNCHTAYDAGRIDRLSMRQYKTNLSLVSGRYGEIEKRILDYFALNPGQSVVYLPGGMELFVMYLVRDGLLSINESYSAPATTPSSPFTWQTVMGTEYNLTEMGREFVQRLSVGQQINEAT
jgi:hypothetical protein